MAKHGNVKIDVEIDMADAVTRARRYVSGMALAVDLSSTVAPERIEQYLNQFATPTKGREDADVAWVEAHRPDWERMITDGIAWLIAADEYAAAIAKTITED